MDEVEHKLSMASLTRLEVLLCSLRIAEDQLAGALPELERLLQKRPSQLWQGDFRPNPMVFGPEHEGAARELIGAIEAKVQRIASRLNGDWRPSPVGADPGADRHESSVWAIGAVTYRAEKYPILRGEIELSKTEPIAAGIPEVVVEFLRTVPGTRDQITRENHGSWGYHYHYLDSRDRRSDTLLTFDRKSTNAANPDLCWEKHAEGDKFKARAGMWGAGKRESVYSVCHPDTSRFSLPDFKRPASDAELVWPLSVEVTAKSAT